NARAGVRAYAAKIPGDRVWVRVNGLRTGLAEADLDAVIGVAGLAGICLPKVETRDEVLRWDRLTGAPQRERGMAADAIKLVLSIESALGVLNAYDMAIAAPRVVSLGFGGAQTATSTPISAASGRSTGPRCCTRARRPCWRRAPRVSTPRS